MMCSWIEGEDINMSMIKVGLRLMWTTFNLLTMERYNNWHSACESVSSYVRDGFIIISLGINSAVLRHSVNGTKVVISWLE